jgi:hypothetical protein
MATTITQMFNKAINEANKSVAQITDPIQKAMAYAAIAQALAQTGGVDASVKGDDARVEAPSNVVSMADSKDSLKNKPKASTAAKKEEAPVPVVQENPVATDELQLPEEWTEEAMELLQSELEFVQEKQKQYGDEALDNCVKAFSNEVLNSVGDINPCNIKGFVAYIMDCEADQASA